MLVAGRPRLLSTRSVAVAEDSFQRWWRRASPPLAHVEQCGKLRRTAGACEGTFNVKKQNNCVAACHNDARTPQKALLDELGRSEGCSACQEHGHGSQLGAPNSIGESQLGDAEAKKAKKQEVEAPSSGSTAPETHRVTARKLDDVDTTDANFDQPPKTRQMSTKTTFADPIQMPSDTSRRSSASSPSMEVEHSGTVQRPSEQEQSSLTHAAKKMRVDGAFEIHRQVWIHLSNVSARSVDRTREPMCHQRNLSRQWTRRAEAGSRVRDCVE